MPRAFIFAGKAAPGYRAAKEVIRLILQVARVLNEDPETSHILKVVFIPNYNVKLAEIIIPGADGEYGVTAGISPIISELIPGLVCLPCLRRAPTPTPSPYSLGYDPGCVHMYMCTHTPTASIDLTSYASLTSPNLSNPHSPPPPSSSHDPHPRPHLDTAGDGDA